MIFHITGSGHRVRESVEDIAKFAIQKLLPRTNYIVINIQLIPNLLEKEGCYGDCIYSDNADPLNPKEFTVRVDSRLEKRKLLTTVAHEMVHVKQFFKGELYDSSVKEKTRWQGKWMSRSRFNYWDQPWEIEAHGREIGIFIQWAESRGLGNQKWTWED